MAGDDRHSRQERLGSVVDRDPDEVTPLLETVHLLRADLETIEPRSKAARERSCGNAARARPDQRDVEAITVSDAKHEIDRVCSSAVRDPE
jgi:hypothetical protein